MSWVTIDQEKCTTCGICVLRCPRCFSLKDEKVSVQADEKCCIVCGHCVSLCPADAITHHRMDMNNFEPVGTPVQFPSDAFMRFIRERRSHRQFKKKEVAKTTIQQLIEAARYAPTGSNVQSVEIIVLETDDRKKRLSDLTIDFFVEMGANAAETLKSMPAGPATPARLLVEKLVRYRENMLQAKSVGYDPIFHHAPVVLMFHSLLETSTPKDNCVIASTTVGLFARTLGLECTYIGLLEIAARSYPPLAEAIGLPEGHQIQSVLIVGYPKLKYLRLVDRNRIRVRWE
ncbi:nitroreductase family protein [Desulfatitalea tepidiphila]|uniref:nitroreductase family protein n=1 Tax=Desulfatitalea tepidiphila TaxID=1185843 RepID=UPI0006B44888|nr:nitroreductase family protein [Desulfatitalea tepidiphila]